MSVEIYGKNELVDDSFQAYLVSNAKFTDVEEYPILTEDMISKDVPLKIMPFNKALNFSSTRSFFCKYR